ncbi:MAG: CBS domain-containing protein [Deltaproteobacteria bacterium]|nr:CBS domain-containing protein [Deltaproteobacteria bacterium]
MDIVTTHMNADFDALASMVAATFVYPGSVGILPAQVQAPVREFLAVHWDLFRLRPRKSLDLSSVTGLVVTDTSSWERLDHMAQLARPGLPVTIWDHHMAAGTIKADKIHLEEVGASVTLLLERIKELDRAFAPMHATLFLLGIYDDTGSLSYPSTTARDVHMAGFLLENGADLNVVAAYLDSALDSRHVDLFGRMLSSTELVETNGLRLGVCVQDADKNLNMLPSVVTKFKELKGLDAAFGLFPTASGKTTVIARGNPKVFDVGAVVRALGGGGHPGAGSAAVQAPVDEVRERVLALVRAADTGDTTVGEIMAQAVETISPDTSLRQAGELMDRTGKTSLLVADSSNRILGTISSETLAKIKNEAQRDKAVTSMIRQVVVSVHPDQTLREALTLMARSDLGYLPVAENGILVGQLTRGAVILNMYDF